MPSAMQLIITITITINTWLHWRTGLYHIVCCHVQLHGKSEKLADSMSA
jgi:hypothetical protein